MSVPEKYLQLSAAYNSLKSALGSLGIKKIDVEGILTGDTMSFISVLRHLPLPATHVGSSDYKLVSSVFKYVRSDLGISPRLSVEQFLLSGSFTLRKIEFLSEIAHEIKKRGIVDRNRPPLIFMSQEESVNPHQVPPPTIVVEDGPDRCPSPTKPLTFEPMLEKLVMSVRGLSESVAALEERLDAQFEHVEAKMAVLEGRLRIIDKLGGGCRGN